MKIKYTIVFEGEMEVPNGLDNPEIIDEIRREFYELNNDATDAKSIEWEAI